MGLFGFLGIEFKKNQKYGIKSQSIKDKFLNLVDEDANAFNFVMKAFSLKKKTKDQQKKRFEEIEKSYKKAIIPPLRMLEITNDLFYIIKMIKHILFKHHFFNETLFWPVESIWKNIVDHDFHAPRPQK